MRATSAESQLHDLVKEFIGGVELKTARGGNEAGGSNISKEKYFPFNVRMIYTAMFLNE